MSLIATNHTLSVDGVSVTPLRINDSPGVDYKAIEQSKFVLKPNDSQVIGLVGTSGQVNQVRLTLLADKPVQITAVATKANTFVAAQPGDVTDFNGFDLLLTANTLFDITLPKAPYSITVKAPNNANVPTVNVAVLMASM